MALHNWLIAVVALSAAGAAQAQDLDKHAATVGAWEIAVEEDRNLCKMYRYYGSTVDSSIEGLVVRYDAGKETVSLTWSTSAPTLFAYDGQIDLLLSFTKGQTINDTWGSRTFRHVKPDDTRYFNHVFSGPSASKRILRDLGTSKLIGLYLGPVLLTALSLDAAEATASLRDCSSKLVMAPSPAQKRM
jgi:hypothetical protein